MHVQGHWSLQNLLLASQALFLGRDALARDTSERMICPGSLPQTLDSELPNLAALCSGGSGTTRDHLDCQCKISSTVSPASSEISGRVVCPEPHNQLSRYLWESFRGYCEQGCYCGDFTPDFKNQPLAKRYDSISLETKDPYTKLEIRGNRSPQQQGFSSPGRILMHDEAFVETQDAYPESDLGEDRSTQGHRLKPRRHRIYNSDVRCYGDLPPLSEWPQGFSPGMFENVFDLCIRNHRHLSLGCRCNVLGEDLKCDNNSGPLLPIFAAFIYYCEEVCHCVNDRPVREIPAAANVRRFQPYRPPRSRSPTRAARRGQMMESEAETRVNDWHSSIFPAHQLSRRH